jgi:hypothetical protein
MTAINHAMTGALIGLVSGQPVVAIPVAFISHFICDALPHYDSAPKGARVGQPSFRQYLLLEATLCVLWVVILGLLRPVHWQLAAVCAFVATSPDLLWINRYRAISRHRPWRPNIFLRFTDRIQWFAQPIGAVVEVAWFVGIIVLLSPFLR